MPIADAVAHPCCFRAADHVGETEVRTGEKCFENLQQWRVADQPGKRGAEQAKVGDLADGTPAVFWRQDTCVPLGVVPDMFALQEDLLLEAR